MNPGTEFGPNGYAQANTAAIARATGVASTGFRPVGILVYGGTINSLGL